MNIVFVTPSMKTGGGNRVFVELAGELAGSHEVFIVAPNNSEQKHTFEIDDRVKVLSVGRTGLTRMRKVLNIAKTIRYLNANHKDDVTIFSDPILSLFSPFFRGRRLYRFMQADDYRIFDDGALLGGLFLKAYKMLCLLSYKSKRVEFIFNSKWVHDRFREDSGKNVKLNIVHPALNLQVFNPKGRKSADGTKSLCLVARRHPMKGLKTFIDVWEKMEENHRSRLSVEIVSHDDLTDFNLSGMLLTIPVCDRDIADAYRRADIFISTSWWEGFGLPPLEAMACGCGVILSDAGGVWEYAVPEENSLMFEPRNEVELKKCLIRLMDDMELCARLSAAGTEQAKNFTWQNSAKQLTDIIK